MWLPGADPHNKDNDKNKHGYDEFHVPHALAIDASSQLALRPSVTVT